MVHIKGKVYLKQDITVYDRLAIYIIGRIASKEKSIWRQIHYTKKQIGILTDLKKPRFWHILLINKVLIAADMLAKKEPEKETEAIEETEKEDPEIRLKRLVDFVCSNIGMTQSQLMKACTPEEMARLYESYVKKIRVDNLNSEKTLMRALVTQNYKQEDWIDRLEEINKNIREVETGKAFEKAIEAKKEKKSNVKIFKFAFNQ